MSKETIYREDAIKAFRSTVARCDPLLNGINMTLPLVEIALRLVPSADRPQGKWFKDDEGTFICSACGSGYKDQPTCMGRPMFEYCPVCGVRMKGADDDKP